MKYWKWQMALWSGVLVSGCGAMPTAPPPPLDADAPAHTQTATFSLG